MREFLRILDLFVSLYRRYVSVQRALDSRADQQERDSAAAVDTCVVCDDALESATSVCAGCGYDPQRNPLVHGDLQTLTWFYWDVMEVLRAVDPELEEMEDLRDDLIEAQFQLRRRLELHEARDLSERWEVERAHDREDREWEQERRRKGLPVDDSVPRVLPIDGLEETGEVAYPVLQQHAALFKGMEATLQDTLAVARRDVPLENYALSCALVVKVANTLPLVRRALADGPL